MTVEVEEPGVVVAICDGCGERRELGLAPDATKAEYVDALEDMGWQQLAPERVKFPTGLAENMVREFPQDFCEDCQSPEPRPAPLIRSAPPRPKVVPDWTGDPVDEWPRRLIWRAAGVREDCGHPLPTGRNPAALCPVCDPIRGRP